MKILLLRVGIDNGYGASSPVYEDNTFEYIPIYYKDKKEIEKYEKRTYKDLISTKGKPLSNFLPSKIRNKKVHYDPEFESFTYGETSNPKRGAILNLNKNDLLVFYMGGYYVTKPFDNQCFIFGFLEVDKVYEWNKDSDEMLRVCSKNAHIISSKSRNNLVIVKGTTNSRLLKKCIQISETNESENNPPYFATEYFQKVYGIRKNIVRAVPMWIKDEKYITKIKGLLDI